MPATRRQFIAQLAGASVFGLAYYSCASTKNAKPTTGFYDLSLAEWSLHKALFSKKITNLDFPVIAKKQFGISTVEYVNQFFMDKAKDQTYLKELLMRCKD